MEELEKKEQGKGNEREEIFSRTVRAGKRTYFFDVKATRAGEHYLTITESKRRFNNDQGKFYYEKHKLFLYKEDFEKLANGLNDVIEFIQTGKVPPEPEIETPENKEKETISKAEDTITNVEFEDLGTETDSVETEEEKKPKE